MFLNIFKREKFTQKLKSPHDLLTLKPSLNMDIFLTQTHRFASEGLYSAPGAVWNTFYDGWTHFIGLHNLNTIKLRRARTFLNITLIAFV